jgi:type VI secretion system protein ImpF
MSEHEIHVRRPLFDRLVDDDPSLFDADPRPVLEPRPLRTLDRAGLMESVRRELELLFNTRSPVPVHRVPSEPRSVVNYGIPDLGMYSPQNQDDRTTLAEILRRAAAVYEPRLLDIRVRIEPVPGRHLAVSAQIEGGVVIDGVPEQVSFQFVQMADGKAQVHVVA